MSRVPGQTQIDEWCRELGYRNYAHYLRSPHWNGVRRGVFKRADYHCELCGAEPPLHCHHDTYERFGSEDLNDLMAVCPSCHRREHREWPRTHTARESAPANPLDVRAKGYLGRPS